MSRDSNKKPGLFGLALGKVRGAGEKVREAGEKVRDASASALRGLADKLEVPKATFEIADTKIDFDIDVAGDTLWATQVKIGELFGRDVNTIGEHLGASFREGEITREATTRKSRVVRMEGNREVEREVEHYNLDAILAVGMRVKSPRATQFRQWAFRILKEYVVHGYALNEERLRNDPAAAQSAAEKIREIRYDEKNLYERVRACVALIASDYDGSSDQIRSFFAAMQNRIHYAACESTAHDIILARADGSKEMMGMSTHLNSKPSLKDARVAKNYLSEHELRAEYRAGDAFFIFAEQMAASEKTMTTTQILAKIDEIFGSYEMPIFPGYGRVYKGDLVKSHTKEQFELFKARTAHERYDDARRLPPA